MNIQQLKAMLMESTFELQTFCDVHPKKRLVQFEGRTVCWICEADKQTALLSEQLHAEHAERLARKSYHMLRKQSVLKDETLVNASFKTYTDNVTPGTEEFFNKEQALKACNAYRKDAEPFNTWFTGDTGVGKSHLAMAMLHALNETDGQHRSCLFVDIDEALRRVRQSFSDTDSTFTEGYLVDMMSDVDFLVIDDIGAETGNIATDKVASDFVSRIIRAVLNARQHKSTIFTTNLTRAQLERVYDKKLVSRAMRDVFLIKFEHAVDKRVRKKVM